MKLMNQLSISPSLTLAFSSFSYRFLSLNIPQTENKQGKVCKGTELHGFCVILSAYTTSRKFYTYRKERWVTEFKLYTLVEYLCSAQKGQIIPSN